MYTIHVVYTPIRRGINVTIKELGEIKSSKRLELCAAAAGLSV